MIRVVRRARRRAPARANGPDDRGLTLVELLVAMFVGSILLAGVATVFTGTLNGVRTTNVKTATGADLRVAIEAMSRTIKVATIPYGQTSAFASASTTSIAFYALLNRTGTTSTAEPIPTLVEYTWNVSPNCLSESLTAGVAIASPAAGGPYYTWPTATKKTKCLLRTTTAPTYTYFTTGSLTETPLSAGSGLSTSDLKAVQSVGLNLVATDPNNSGVTGVPAETRITLENLS